MQLAVKLQTGIVNHFLQHTNNTENIVINNLIINNQIINQ
jgi:hypothetical protein